MTILKSFMVLMFVLSFNAPLQSSTSDQRRTITTNDLIQAVNTIRVNNGLSALRINSILMGTAQYTADMMSSDASRSHLSGLKERIIAAGYGAGYPETSLWATENFAVSAEPLTAQQIVNGYWSDETHMKPMNSSYYCDVGAGVAEADGTYYYILEVAYNSDVTCGKSQKTAISTPLKLTQTATNSAPQWIVPVSRSTPDANGNIYHVVRQGQSLWMIAIAYGTKINTILALNNLGTEVKTVYNGQRLLIPTSLTPQPTATAFVTATPKLEDTPTPQPTLTLSLGTPAPSPTPTVDVAAQAAQNERLRGGLFTALVIGIVLILGGLLVNRR